MNTVWKKVIIDNTETHYSVSNTGLVRNDENRKILKPHLVGGSPKARYQRVSLILNPTIPEYIHRLVAKTFLGEAPEGHEVHHKDGNTHNNHVDNIQWVTHAQNLAMRNKRELPRFTVDSICQMRLLYDSKIIPAIRLAEQFGYSRHYTYLIVNREICNEEEYDLDNYLINNKASYSQARLF